MTKRRALRDEPPNNEIIAAAMLLGAEFKQQSNYWTCRSADGIQTRFYIRADDAAFAFLSHRGFTADSSGQLVKIP
jgi:hypothetical protein